MFAGYYLSAFDMADAAYGTITLATAGKPNVVLDLTDVVGPDNNSVDSSIFFHYVGVGGTDWCTSVDPTGDPRLTEVCTASLALRLQTLLRTEAAAQGWVSPSDITVSWRRQDTVPSYRFEYTATFSITWSQTLGSDLVGFAGNVSGAMTYTGVRVPLFCIVPTLQYASDVSTDYEPDNIGNHLIPDDGSGGFGTSRETSPIYRDWVQQFETKEKTERRSAVTAHPETFRGLFENCRGHLAFMVVWYRDTTHGGEVFFLRDDGMSWHPERASSGNDAQFHIPFRAHLVGEVATS